jgi:hypothetical protein
MKLVLTLYQYAYCCVLLHCLVIWYDMPCQIIHLQKSDKDVRASNFMTVLKTYWRRDSQEDPYPSICDGDASSGDEHEGPLVAVDATLDGHHDANDVAGTGEQVDLGMDQQVWPFGDDGGDQLEPLTIDLAYGDADDAGVADQAGPVVHAAVEQPWSGLQVGPEVNHLSPCSETELESQQPLPGQPAGPEEKQISPGSEASETELESQQPLPGQPAGPEEKQISPGSEAELEAAGLEANPSTPEQQPSVSHGMYEAFDRQKTVYSPFQPKLDKQQLLQLLAEKKSKVAKLGLLKYLRCAWILVWLTSLTARFKLNEQPHVIAKRCLNTCVSCSIFDSQVSGGLSDHM